MTPQNLTLSYEDASCEIVEADSETNAIAYFLMNSTFSWPLGSKQRALNLYSQKICSSWIMEKINVTPWKSSIPGYDKAEH